MCVARPVSHRRPVTAASPHQAGRWQLPVDRLSSPPPRRRPAEPPAVLSRRCMGNGAGPQEPAARTGYVFWHPRIGTGPSALFPPLAGTLPGHDPLFGHQVLLERQSPPFCRCQSVFSRLLWLENEKVLIGKTDEDLGWNIHDRVYREAEMSVLEKGEVMRDILGQCLVRGRLHQIASTKFPIYRGKHIIGLLGYFEDVDEDCRHQERLHQASLVDAETGLLNFRGLWLLGEDYMDAYRRYGTDYVCVVLEVPEYEQVFRDYGDEVAGKLLQAITDQLLTLHSLKGSLAHLSGCRFFTHQSLDRDFRNTLLGLTTPSTALPISAATAAPSICSMPSSKAQKAGISMKSCNS